MSESLSPWGMPDLGTAIISPLERPFNAVLSVPGSKSYTTRALAIASVAAGTTILRHPLFSDDSYWCSNALERLGLAIDADRDAGTIKIRNEQPKFVSEPGRDNPYLGSAGTAARFLPGLVAAKGQGEITLTASEQLSGRPIDGLVQSLRDLGVVLKMPASGSFPLTITGGTLRGGKTFVSGETSSQYLSGLLICAPLAKERVEIQVSDKLVQEDYVRMTLDIMEKFGVTVNHDERFRHFTIEPQSYQGTDISIEADASTATCFLALAGITGSSLKIDNIGSASLQPDVAFAEILEEMCCEIDLTETSVAVVGRSADLKGGRFNLNKCSDSTPALVATAAFASSKVAISGVAHIRKHESDRLAVLAEMLKRFGVACIEREDGLEISPDASTIDRALVDPHDDHRMAMAFAVIGAAARGVDIQTAACVSKTCPQFYELIGRLGVGVSFRQD
ncbi:MAG: 3-phosphoshikimate 1-carboxyvinyltransferase [Pseudomonadota bacterium]